MKARQMERVGRKASGFGEARELDLEQLRALSLEERQRIAKTLRERAFGRDAPDVRAAERAS